MTRFVCYLTFWMLAAAGMGGLIGYVAFELVFS